MADYFDTIWPALHKREGGAKYTNRAADRGGPTKHGVTAAKLGEYRGLGRPATAAEVMALTEAEAKALYRQEFVAEPGFGAVALVAPAVAEELIDTGVNMGTYYPRRWLQEVLNLCNRQGQDFPDLLVDAQIGKKTVSAIRALIALRGQKQAEAIVVTCLNGEQYARYKAITLAGGPNGLQEQNFVGWIQARIGLA